MLATRIIAIRHGETAWNAEARIQGQLDIALNEKGRWQARRLARALAKSEQITALYCSDLSRARDTAQPIAEATGLTTATVPGLRERGFGSYEGQTFTELEAKWPGETARWRRRDPDWAPPNGETLSAFLERAVQTTHRLAARHADEQIVLVAHGGVVDALYRAANRLEIGAPRTWALGNASINRLLWTPQGLTVVGWSDSAHLDDQWQDEATA